MTNPARQSASELAAAIQHGELNAVEVLDSHLRRISHLNHHYNAIITLDKSGARFRAWKTDEGEVSGPLAGVPVTVKDGFRTAHLRTTAGLPSLFHYHPENDSDAVKLMRQAGAVIIGKTNLPPLSLDLQTINPIFGVGRNPHNTDYTCGGSTGGGAAAVAAGLTPLELGNDYAGSLRVPAHCCGVSAFKPTEGTTPSEGYITELPGSPHTLQHMVTTGVITRSVPDLRLGWEVLSGQESHATPPALENCRFAYWWDFAMPLDDATELALDNFLDKLEDAGSTIDEVFPEDFTLEQAWRTWGNIAGYEIADGLLLHELLLVRSVTHGLFGDDVFTRSVQRGISRKKVYHAALDTRDHLIEALDSFLDQWDAWLCPVMPTPAFAHQRPGKPRQIKGKTVSYLMSTAGHTAPFNATGHPVVVLPLERAINGLPVGIQIVGKRDSDDRLLAIAEALTTITPAFIPPPIDLI